MRVRFPPPALTGSCAILLSAMKTEERMEARRLRREGLSIRDISALVGVSRSSVSHWVRDIELTPSQLDELRRRNPAFSPDFAGTRIWAERCREARRRNQQDGRALARRGEPLHAAGCMLYWAEGEKHRNRVALANSDPDVVRVFLAFLRAYFGVPDDRVALYCNLFATTDEQQEEIERHWLTRARAATELPPQVGRQRLLEIQREEAAQSTALRDLQARRFRHRDRPEHLRGDPGVRRL
jgi:AcrR family transcriptional regulator